LEKDYWKLPPRGGAKILRRVRSSEEKRDDDDLISEESVELRLRRKVQAAGRRLPPEKYASTALRSK
jgi:hypothetical protein